MKRCPKCSQLFTNELLKFCRSDGAELVGTGDGLEEATTIPLSQKDFTLLVLNPIAEGSRRFRETTNEDKLKSFAD